jgi:hypothetical protein
MALLSLHAVVRMARPAAARRSGVARSSSSAIPQRRNASAAFLKCFRVGAAAARTRVALNAVPPAADDSTPVTNSGGAAAPVATATDAPATPAVAAAVVAPIAPPLPLLLPPPKPLFGIAAAQLAAAYTWLAAALSLVSFNLLVAPELALPLTLGTPTNATALTPALQHITRVWVRACTHTFFTRARIL